MAEYTPMMMQYLETKEQYKDCILFYRLGDFYEMFFDDAITVSRELELTLTGKSCGQEERAPMCGIPYHAVDGYLNRLIGKGYRVAICRPWHRSARPCIPFCAVRRRRHAGHGKQIPHQCPASRQYRRLPGR